MSFQTEFARRVFPRDQTFMARRKLRQVLLALAIGLLVSGALLGLFLLAYR